MGKVNLSLKICHLSAIRKDDIHGVHLGDDYKAKQTEWLSSEGSKYKMRVLQGCTPAWTHL